LQDLAKDIQILFCVWASDFERSLILTLGIARNLGESALMIDQTAARFDNALSDASHQGRTDCKQSMGSYGIGADDDWAPFRCLPVHNP